MRGGRGGRPWAGGPGPRCRRCAGARPGTRRTRNVGQRVQPQPGLAGHGEAAGRQQGPDLMHRPGDGGAVHPVKQGESGVRELEPQHDQSRNDPIGERQLTVRARALSAQPVPVTAPLPQPRFLLRGPRRGKLGDQLAQAATWQTGTDTMRQGRAGPSRRHILIVPRGPSRSRQRHTKISHYARDLLSCTKSLLLSSRSDGNEVMAAAGTSRSPGGLRNPPDQY